MNVCMCAYVCVCVCMCVCMCVYVCLYVCMCMCMCVCVCVNRGQLTHRTLISLLLRLYFEQFLVETCRLFLSFATSTESRQFETASVLRR